MQAKKTTTVFPRYQFTPIIYGLVILEKSLLIQTSAAEVDN